ncbi:MAG: glucosaminidase domain-containing protein [Porphyromonas sp.]|nr:glucosaminidase domain-containing protein [Porphyromonas sp.]
MKKTNLLLVLCLIAVLSSCGSSKKAVPTGSQRVPAARTNTTYNQYIERYAQIALYNQNKYGIPASITLAQGLLESNAGNSRLATQANNHFGIKCHSSWRGGKIYHSDDQPNECFRVYSDPASSYEDHAQFLQQARYRDLFKLAPTDYKGWARGLQRAGYATDKGYANKLIKIIEDYRLYLIDDNNPGRLYAYDQPKQPKRGVATTNTPKERKVPPQSQVAQPTGEREIFKSYGLLYIIALQGDDLASISRDVGISEKKLLRYNDFPEGYPLSAGDIVYLQKKLKRAQPPHYQHTVQIGESIHEIAQKYGIQLQNLYKINHLSPDYNIEEGEVLLLR